MPLPRLAVAVSSLLLMPACAPRWHTDGIIDSRAVARALGDPADMGSAPFDPKKIPDFKAPEKLRPCCAFGVDLRPEVGPVPVPLVELENVRGPEEIGPHGYDKGDMTREKNGLVYTCRGGFIDIAHVRDNADRTMYMSLQIARNLPSGVTIDFVEEGTQRRVIVAAVPPETLERHGRWKVATTLALWANHHLGNWHEVVTWYGFESIKGTPERMSAFSPEDIYSNTFGALLGAGIVLDREMRSRDEYDVAMQAWMREGLRRLAVVPKPQARAAMKAVDGLWWDSQQRVPNMKLVTRRFVSVAVPVKPWIVSQAVEDPAMKEMCKGQPGPLALELPEKLGETPISEIVRVEFKFDKWEPERFPLPAKQGNVATQDDFEAILKDVREAGAKELGPDFTEMKRGK